MPPYYIGGGTNPYSSFGASPESGPVGNPVDFWGKNPIKRPIWGRNPPTGGSGSTGGEVGQVPNDNWPWLRQPPGKLPVGPVGPIITGPFTENGPNVSPATPPAGSVLGAQAIRPTGDPKGYDPSYLQNLATAIGGLFSRPQGNLSFNPLGDLSEISPSSGMEGNAPLPGLPSTWLQDALNGLGFSFMPKPRPVHQRPRIGDGGGGEDGGRGRGRGRNLQ